MNCKLSSVEFLALKSFYFDLSGVNWHWEADTAIFGQPWNFTYSELSQQVLSRPCLDIWQGLTCELIKGGAGTCSITSLSLPGFGLTGSFPASTGNLSYVTTLILTSNKIQGTVPVDLSKLDLLEVLLLDDNLLTGSVPLQILSPAAATLTQLSLQTNSLHGSIPANLISSFSLLTKFYLNQNLLTSVLPKELGALSALEGFEAFENRFTGTIPTEFANCRLLESLVIYENSLSGTIPSELAHLEHLTTVDFYFNMLTGAISSEFGGLKSLSEFIAEVNLLSGSIPSEFSGLSVLTELLLNTNYLTNTFPQQLGIGLSRLESLLLDSNFLNGTIPTTIGMMKRLLLLDIGDNCFSGILPEELGTLESLQKLYIDDTEISGTIPSELGALNLLEFLTLGFNRLTGSIPSIFGSMKNLESIYLYNNYLTGTLPTELSNLQDVLVNLFVDNNCLTGTIPPQLGTLHKLKNLYLYENILTGSIPSVLGNVTALLYCHWENNLLTGVLPSEVGRLHILELLSINNNYFTGTLPSQLGDMKLIEEFGFGANFFTGVFPSAVAGLHRLTLLDLSVNLLTGNLNEVFKSNTFLKELIVLDISENGFTGSFPAEVFALPLLTVLSATSNCFSGSLTCSSLNLDNDNVTVFLPPSSLQVANLNGLSSGLSCRQYVSHLIPNVGYYPKRYMSGTIPECLWLAPNLTTLYVIGNGFHGTIPEIFPETLTNISLAYNQLSGVIPISLQQSTKLQFLDFSHNRLSGSLLASSLDRVWPKQLTFSLESNRLSGFLPLQWNGSILTSSLMQAAVLNGNLFNFESSAQNADSSSSIAFNGSAVLNISMMITSPLLLLGFLAVLTSFSPMIQRMLVYLFQSTPYNLWLTELRDSLFLFTETSAHFSPTDEPRKSMTNSASRSVLVLIPASIVAIIGLFALTWLVSVAFLHGVPPIVVCSGLITVAVAVGLTWLRNILPTIAKPIDSSITLDAPPLSEVNWKINEACKSSRVLRLVVLLGNCCAMGLLNGIYLVAVLQNNPYLALIQIGLALIKVMWNAGVVALTVGNRRDSARYLWFRYSLQYINYILIPCLASSVVENSCFLQLLQQSTTPNVASAVCPSGNLVHVSGEGWQCEGNLTVAWDNVDASFEAPFTYSFQCGSAIITNYVPVMLYIHFVSGFVFPVSILGYFSISKHFFSDREGQTHVSPDSVLGRILRILPRVLFPEIYSSLYSQPDELLAKISSPDFIPLMPITAVVSKLLINLTTFLTFGLAFPYLAAVSCSASITETGIWLLALGRFRWMLSQRRLKLQNEVVLSLQQFPLSEFDETKRADGSSSINLEDSISDDRRSRKLSQATTFLMDRDLRASCHSALDGVSSNLSILVLVVYFFWAALSFDQAADVYGTNAGLATMFSILGGGPLIVFGLWFGSPRCFPSNSGVEGSNFDLDGQSKNRNLSNECQSILELRSRNPVDLKSFSLQEVYVGKEDNINPDMASPKVQHSSSAFFRSEKSWNEGFNPMMG